MTNKLVMDIEKLKKELYNDGALIFTFPKSGFYNNPEGCQ